MPRSPMLMPLAVTLLFACTGGQTGDPGVADFTSLDPNPPERGGSGGGSCLGSIAVTGDAAERPSSIKRRRLDDTHLVVLDPVHGLSVFDDSGDVPRVAGHLPLPIAGGDLHIVGKRALMSQRNFRPSASYYVENGYPAIDDEAALLVVDLSDVKHPMVVDKVSLQEGARISHLVVSEGRALLYVLSDGGAAIGCRGRNHHALLVRYELVDDRLVERARLELGGAVEGAGFMGNDLVVYRRSLGVSGFRPSSVSLTDPEAPMLERALPDVDRIPFSVHVDDAAEGIDVSPVFSRAWWWEKKHWVRLRVHQAALTTEGPDELSEQELFSPSERGRMEVVAGDEDPNTGAALSSIEVNPWASFVRVGSLLVSLVRPARQGPQPTHIELFDLSAPERPRRAGELMVPDLALIANERVDTGWTETRDQASCLDCPSADLVTRALVVPNALVLRTVDSSDHPALQVLDLSNPSAPSLSAPLELPGDGALQSAFSHGSAVYYTFRVEDASKEGRVPSARFYFGRIDLLNPAAPKLTAPINVPGQLVAVDGERLYTREIALHGAAYEVQVHRLALRDNRAEVLATHAFRDRMVYALALDGAGHLLADLGEALSDFLFERYYARPVTALALLDAETLEPVGQGKVGPLATRLAVQAGHALYRAAEGYLLMNLQEPSRPRAQAYVPTLSPYAASGLLTEDSLVLQDSGGLKRLELSFGNLAP